MHFDGNRYCVPQRYVGRRLTLKADSSSVTIYDQHHEIVSYARCWRRGQTFGAERFQKELAELTRRGQAVALPKTAVRFLDGLCSDRALEAYSATSGRHATDPCRGKIPELLELIRQYGPEAVAGAIEKAPAARAFGADYIANILRQQQSAPRSPATAPAPRSANLNELATDPLSLAEYDAFILRSRKESR